MRKNISERKIQRAINESVNSFLNEQQQLNEMNIGMGDIKNAARVLVFALGIAGALAFARNMKRDYNPHGGYGPEYQQALANEIEKISNYDGADNFADFNQSGGLGESVRRPSK